MKSTLITISLVASASMASAAVSFTGGGGDNLWHTEDNWTHDGDGHTGLPQGGEATSIATGQNAVVNANDTAGIGDLTVETGASLTINTGVTLQLNNTKAAIVDGTLNVDGLFTVLGGSGSNLTVNSTGIVNVTGTLDARKNTTVTPGGTLNISSTAGTWVPQDKLAIGNGSTLHFDIFNGSVATIAGSSVNLGLHLTGSNLSLDLLNTGVGSYDLITGIQDIEWYSGGTNVNDREFAESVTNLGDGLDWDVVYDHSGGQGNRKVSLVITAIPEPSSTALLGLGGLALILRRRK